MNIIERIDQASEELSARCPTDALRTLEKGKAEMSSSLETLPERTQAELTLRFIELAQSSMEKFQLDDAKKHLKDAARLATHTVKLEKLEPWK